MNTNDPGTIDLMLDQVSKTLNTIGSLMQTKWLADSAYANKSDTEIMETRFKSITLYSPPTGNQKCDALTIRKSDNQAMKNLRKRMSLPEAKIIYKDRAKTIEFANAVTKNLGMGNMLVRGLEKVTNMALLYVVCHNTIVFFRN